MTICQTEHLICVDPALLGAATVLLPALGIIVGLLMAASRR